MKKPAPFPVQAEDNANTTTPRRRNHDALSPRLVRLLTALLRSPVWRRDADSLIGTTNAPHYVEELRGMMGYEAIDTERVPVTTRDGETAYVGKYHLRAESRPLALELLGARHEA